MSEHLILSEDASPGALVPTSRVRPWSGGSLQRHNGLLALTSLKGLSLVEYRPALTFPDDSASIHWAVVAKGCLSCGRGPEAPPPRWLCRRALLAMELVWVGQRRQLGPWVRPPSLCKPSLLLHCANAWRAQGHALCFRLCLCPLGGLR